MRARVLSNFSRQAYPNKRLLIVENGDACHAYSGDDADCVLVSEAHQSSARNAGIAWLKRNRPDAYWVSMDDDDYYGEGYLSEHVLFAKPGRATGKWFGWYQFDSGLVYFGHGVPQYEPVPCLLGATIGSYVADAALFPEVQTGEEGGYCSKMDEVFALSTQHFCASREGDPNEHTHKASEKKLWRRAGWTGVRVSGTWDQWVGGEPPAGPGGFFQKRSDEL